MLQGLRENLASQGPQVVPAHQDQKAAWEKWESQVGLNISGLCSDIGSW